MDLAHVLAFGLGALAGLVAALKVIAPVTKTTKDDAVLEVLEKVKDIADHLGVGAGAAPAPAA